MGRPELPSTEEVIALYNAGMSLPKIAEQLGRGVGGIEGTIKRLRREGRVGVRQRRVRNTPGKAAAPTTVRRRCQDCYGMSDDTTACPHCGAAFPELT
jgi:transposase